MTATATNRHLSRMLLEGVTLECRAESVSPKSAPWEAVAVNVYLPLSTATHPDSRTTN